MSEDTTTTDTGDEQAPARKSTPKKTPAKRAAPAKRSAGTAKKAAPRKTGATATRKTSPRKTAPRKPAAKTAAEKTAVKTESLTEKTAPEANADSIREEAATTRPEAAEAPETVSSSQSSSDQKDTNGAPTASGAAERDWLGYAVRGAFMLFFGALAWLASMFAFTLAGLQFVLLLLTGKPNDFLVTVIDVLGRYIAEIMRYLSFKSDERPFPLGKDLPKAEEG
jgi:hypothetical protein